MSNIAIYCDAGVSPSALQQLIQALKEPFLVHFNIEKVNRHFFLTTGWEKNTSLIIMPGGRDIPYHQALKGEANARIRAYVERGGHYLGICAGGYYGAASIEFAKGEEGEICEERELKFFSGKAIGPAYGNDFCYNSEVGARAMRVKWEMGVSTLYYNGGCFFKNPSQATEILGKYSDLPQQPAAVVYCPIGEGGALLSGVHPEYSPKDSFWLYLFNKILT